MPSPGFIATGFMASLGVTGGKVSAGRRPIRVNRATYLYPGNPLQCHTTRRIGVGSLHGKSVRGKRLGEVRRYSAQGYLI